MAEHLDIIGSVIGIMIFIIAYFLQKYFTKVDKIERNYLDRFDDLKEKINVIQISQGRMEEKVNAIADNCCFHKQSYDYTKLNQEFKQ